MEIKIIPFFKPLGPDLKISRVWAQMQSDTTTLSGPAPAYTLYKNALSLD